MANVNKVTVMGVLGRDPETKQFPNGGSMTTFSVATTEFWKDKTTGERKEATEWHRISTNNRLAEIASKYLKKGSKVYIEGSFKTRKWKNQRHFCRQITLKTYIFFAFIVTFLKRVFVFSAIFKMCKITMLYLLHHIDFK